VPTGENKIFSIDISAYLQKKGGVNVFSDFTVHCLMAGTPRWGNTFYPRVGQWVTVAGEVVGEYKYNNRESLCVVLDDFTPAPAAATRVIDDSPKRSQATPRYDKLCAQYSAL
jgi:hypothetical protein